MADAARYDVVVVGAGPAGLASAWAAASRGKKVALLDENATAGGQIWRAAAGGQMPATTRRWLKKLASVSCDVIPRATVVAEASPRELIVEVPEGSRRVAFDRLVVATGARELFLPFPGWTLPGVYGVGGLQALVKAGLPVAGRHIVIAGSGPLLLAVAAAIRKRGAEIMCIAEQASQARVFRFGINLLSRPTKLALAMSLRARLAHVPYDFGWFPVRAEGDERVASVTLTDGRTERTYACDMLACGFGLVPNTEIAQMLGCRLDSGFVSVNENMETSVAGIYCAGEPVAIGGENAAVVQGLIAGAAAAGARPSALLHFSRRRWLRFARRLAHAFELRDGMRGEVGAETPVCRCEDVTFRRMQRHESWREAKIQARAGMGPCQGRICGAACKYLFNWNESSVRPPVLPARVESLIDE